MGYQKFRGNFPGDANGALTKIFTVCFLEKFQHMLRRYQELFEEPSTGWYGTIRSIKNNNLPKKCNNVQKMDRFEMSVVL